MNSCTLTAPGKKISENLNKYMVYILLVVMLLLAQLYSPGYLEGSHMLGVIRLAAFMGMAAISQTIAILSGGIDLSIPTTISFSYILAAQLMMGKDENIGKALIGVLILGLIIGVINGAGVCLMNIPPFIMTLGVSTITKGAYMIYTKGTPKGRTAPLISTISNRNFMGVVPYIVIVWVIFAVITMIILHKTPYGRRIYSVGSNAKATQFSGTNTHGIIFSVYIVSAVVAALTGFFLIGYTGESYLNAGANYDTQVIAAVIIGGTSITGGKGSYLGSAAGALIMTVFTDFLQIVKVAEGFRIIGQGAMILILIALYAREKQVRV